MKATNARTKVEEMIETARGIEKCCSDVIINSEEIEAVQVSETDRLSLGLKLRRGRVLTVKKDFILGRIASQSRVPNQYLERMIEDDPELAIRCVTSGFQHNLTGGGEEREMKVRIYSPAGEPEILRGLVSSRYMPMSSAEILEVFAELYPLDTMEIGKSSIDEYDLLLQSRSVKDLTKSGEVEVGDIFPGFSLTNNEISLGAFEAIARLYRLACSNGMVVSVSGMGGANRKIHLGDEEEGSRFIRQYLGEQLHLMNTQMEYGIPLIQTATKTKCDINQLYYGLRKKENIKTDQLAEMFVGWEHEKGLGKNVWGAVNGITRMARDTKSIVESHRFEKLAGELIQKDEKQIKGLEALGRSYLDDMQRKGKDILVSAN